MEKKQKTLLLSSIGLVLALGATALVANAKNADLFGESGYSSVKTNSITFTAEDFKNGSTIVKNGNPFTLSGDVEVNGDVVTFKKGASLTRADTGGTGEYVGSIIHGMKITGLTVAKPSQTVVHGGSDRTWYKVINDRGDGDARGLYSSVEEADAVGYTNINHEWTNDRDDNDPSAFWIETANPTLTATGGEFSFKTITYTYDCLFNDGSNYSIIMAKSKRGSWKVTDEKGNNLPAHVKVGDVLKFKVELDKLFAKQYDVTVTASATRDDTNPMTLTANDGIYSLTIAKSYSEADDGKFYTYINVIPHEKTATPISTLDELKAIDKNGNYYLANDIEVKNTFGSDTFGCLGASSFSGVLDGNGHKVYSKTIAKGAYTYGLFENFYGVIKNLNASFSFCNYQWNPGGLVRNMNGGLIENVKIDTYVFDDINDTAGGIVHTLNNGTIRDCEVNIVCTPDVNGNNVGAIASNVVGGSVENVKVHTQFDVETADAKLMVTGDSNRLKNCSISNDYVKVNDSALLTPIETEETYRGMPLTKMENLKHTDGLLNKSISLAMADKVAFYLKSDQNFVLEGNQLQILPNQWTYVELTKRSDETWDVLTYSGTFSTATRGTDGIKNTLGEMFGFYNWSAAKDFRGNVLASPLYISYKQEMGTKVADSILKEYEVVNDSPIKGTTYKKLAGGNHEIAEIAAPAKGQTMSFAMKAENVLEENYDYFYLLKYSADIVSTVDATKVNPTWTKFKITMDENGTYTINVYSIDQNGSSSLTRLRELTGISMTKLGDYLSIFPWKEVGVYSTPVYIK